MKSQKDKQKANAELLTQAKAGNIRAFHTLFSEFQPQLKSYLYRLLANRNDMEDMAQDTFIAAFENIHSFRGEASLKSWVFTIATNKARRYLKNESRWHIETMEITKSYAHQHPDVLTQLDQTHRLAPKGAFDIQEHIDYCFTCVTRMLPLKQQIALILIDLYGFKIGAASQIMDMGVGGVKHLIRNARKTMISIFDHTCALVNKNGICNQCSGLNGRFNPKQDHQAELMKIKWVKERQKHDMADLLKLRTALVKEIDPLQTSGADLHELFLQLNRKINETKV